MSRRCPSPRFRTIVSRLLLVVVAALVASRPVGSRDIDLEIERFLGAQVASAFKDSAGVDNDPLLADWVNEIGRQVSAQSPRRNVPYSFTILGTDVANAFAGPAGYIFVTRGMLDTIDSDDELAAILAHETAHVTKRHAIQQVGGNLLVFALLASLRGERYRGVRTFASLANVVRTLAKSREMEHQADDLGLVYCWKAGYDPGGLARFFEGYDLRGRSLLAEYFDTHPAPARRLAFVRESKYVRREDLALRETTAQGLEARSLPNAARKARAARDPLALPATPSPAIPSYLENERREIGAQAAELRRRLMKGYRAQDLGATLKQVLLINNQGDFRWLYVSARAYAIQARVEDIFARSLRVADTVPGIYDALAVYADGPAAAPATIDSSLGRTNLRSALRRTEGAVAPIERASRAVTTVLADLNNRFLRLDNEQTWLRYAALEGLLRYAESELSRADRAAGIGWRQVSLARIRRYQHWLNENLPEDRPERRELWTRLTIRRFGAWFPNAGPAGDATVRAALAIEKRKSASEAEEGRGETLWADWVLQQKGIPENIATALRLLILDLQREDSR
ncbi:MAG: M48 family metalloprotease [Capsulimonadales bacterium]|nr:M48 family metalloprotease [Capsulimonadales bacterium]